ncbi:hypothetical protein HD554DRAFT_2168885 [Boletus coccyginus]|nr:hypothetical protein HD554DRAFT_2168885 [Boletus coccyginus]
MLLRRCNCIYKEESSAVILEKEQASGISAQELKLAFFSPALPTVKNDLEILEDLKSTIKDGQHEFYRAVPQPAALASIYMGHIPKGRAHPDQYPSPSFSLDPSVDNVNLPDMDMRERDQDRDLGGLVPPPPPTRGHWDDRDRRVGFPPRHRFRNRIRRV